MFGSLIGCFTDDNNLEGSWGTYFGQENYTPGTYNKNYLVVRWFGVPYWEACVEEGTNKVTIGSMRTFFLRWPWQRKLQFVSLKTRNVSRWLDVECKDIRVRLCVTAVIKPARTEAAVLSLRDDPEMKKAIFDLETAIADVSKLWTVEDMVANMNIFVKAVFALTGGSYWDCDFLCGVPKKND